MKVVRELMKEPIILNKKRYLKLFLKQIILFI